MAERPLVSSLPGGLSVPFHGPTPKPARMAAFNLRVLWTLVALGVLIVFGTTGHMVLEEQAPPTRYI